MSNHIHEYKETSIKPSYNYNPYECLEFLIKPTSGIN